MTRSVAIPPVDPFGLPRVAIPDPMLVTGSMLLVDPTYPSLPWAAGLPASVPNLASPFALAQGVEADALTFTNNHVAPDVVERTGKGGLHVAIKHGVGSGTRYAALESAALKAFWASHLGHAWYLGLSGIYTQDHALATPNSSTRMFGLIVSSSFDIAAVRPGATSVSGQPGTNRTLSNIQARTTLGEFLVDGAWSSLSGIPSASNIMLMWHNGGNASPGQSWALHAAYLEDLTISGRTAATVHGLFAARQAALHTDGGRYHADTYTNPATL